MNTPAGNTLSTAEHTMAMMLALSRNIAPAYQSLIEGTLGPQPIHGHAAGRQDAGHRRPGPHRPGRRRAGQGVGNAGLGYDPFLSKERAQELGIEPFATVAEMLPHVDYLTVHTPLTEETANLIGTTEIQAVRPGVRLINCARGGIYDEAALVEGLKSGQMAGVALDVFADGAVHQQPAVRHARRALHAAPGRQHRRGPDSSGGRRGRAC